MHNYFQQTHETNKPNGKDNVFSNFVDNFKVLVEKHSLTHI